MQNTEHSPFWLCSQRYPAEISTLRHKIHSVLHRSVLSKLRHSTDFLWGRFIVANVVLPCWNVDIRQGKMRVKGIVKEPQKCPWCQTVSCFERNVFLHEVLEDQWRPTDWPDWCNFHQNRNSHGSDKKLNIMGFQKILYPYWQE